MEGKMRRYWIGVASKDHVMRGVELGICQFCHGKSAPAQRLSKGDFVIYYSSKMTREGTELCQKFTAFGMVMDDVPYQVVQFPGFEPFRRNVEYLKVNELDIKLLIDALPFIRNKKSWGYVFRFGFLEIDQESFEIIAQGMLGYNPLRKMLE
jgi:predicted RNA-binding protein